MFKDITHYAPKRKGRRGPIPLDGQREPSGRLARRAGPPEFMVYFVTHEHSPFIKVGQTKNIRERIENYESAFAGEVRCLCQLVVASKDDARKLEQAAIKHLSSRFERARREWFQITEAELAGVVADIVASGGVTVIDQRGHPGREEQWSVVASEVSGAYNKISSKNAMRRASHRAL